MERRFYQFLEHALVSLKSNITKDFDTLKSTNVHQFIVLSFTQFLLRQTQKTMFQYGFFVVGSFIITD